jgi:AcrR family transcriptional regulator
MSKAVLPARAFATRLGQRTMTKFLNAAADVFSRRGYEGSTIRAIAKKAQVNLGTLNHYWGSKQELFCELFDLRFRPLRQEYLRRLRAVEASSAPGSPPQAIDVLRSIVEPVFFLNGDAEHGPGAVVESSSSRRRFHALYGRALMDPSPQVISAMAKLFEEPIYLFIKLMRDACPHVSNAEIDWRVNCIMGAQIFAEVYEERGRQFFGAEADVEEQVAADWILHFLMYGLSAPPFGQPSGLAGIKPRAAKSKAPRA